MLDRVTPADFDGRYHKAFLAGWGAMDFNGHLANRAYLDLAADVRMAFFAEQGARFVLENEIWTPAGERAVTVRSTGGWLDLRARRLMAPPAPLLAAMQQVPRAPGFVELPSFAAVQER